MFSGRFVADVLVLETRLCPPETPGDKARKSQGLARALASGSVADTEDVLLGARCKTSSVRNLRCLDTHWFPEWRADPY